MDVDGVAQGGGLEAVVYAEQLADRDPHIDGVHVGVGDRANDGIANSVAHCCVDVDRVLAASESRDVVLGLRAYAGLEIVVGEVIAVITIPQSSVIEEDRLPGVALYEPLDFAFADQVDQADAGLAEKRVRVVLPLRGLHNDGLLNNRLRRWRGLVLIAATTRTSNAFRHQMSVVLTPADMTTLPTRIRP